VLELSFDVWEFSKCGSSHLSSNHLTLESPASASFLLPLTFVSIRVGLEETLRFNELVRLLEQNGFRLIREKSSVRYYAKAGVDRLIRVDYHGTKEIPTGTCNAILKAAGLKR
jgi:predicted RNA binding protein YcfA (HicA-like mRNA interferase family)